MGIGTLCVSGGGGGKKMSEHRLGALVSWFVNDNSSYF